MHAAGDVKPDLGLRELSNRALLLKNGSKRRSEYYCGALGLAGAQNVRIYRHPLTVVST